jgi:catechol 2,3-dioxygenase-like lactoylglutathione lyase family enzyme
LEDTVPELTGVLETSLYVDDLERSRTFYTSLFEFEVLASDHRMCALDVSGRQVLLLFKKGASEKPSETSGGTIPPHDADGELHVAFAVPTSSLPEWEHRLCDLQIAVQSRVCWPRGGRSLYFNDPDRHVVELATPGIWETY